MTGSLLRELARQSLLLTAREEFGLSTRDAALGESCSDGKEFVGNDKPRIPPLSLLTLISQEQNGLAILFNPDKPVPLWQKEFDLHDAQPHAALATLMEEWSRGEFVELLESLGYEASPVKSSPAASVPKKIQEQLGEMNVLAQFTVVRELHKLIADSGSSPARYGALARGYSHLAELTGSYFSPMQKVFMARALLYAERVVAQSQGTAPALWNRAYVRAWVGLPVLAMQDLVRAKKSAGESNSKLAPKWAVDLELFCLGNLPELRKRIESDDATSASSMLYWLMQSGREEEESRVEAIREVIDGNPDCLHMMFETSKLSSLGAKATSRYIINMLPEIVAQRLEVMPELPQSLAAQLENLTPQSHIELQNLTRRLKTAGTIGADRREPSLDALSEVVEEMMFLSAWNSYMYEHALGIDLAELSVALIPLAEDHRLGAMIIARGKNRQEGLPMLQACLKEMDIRYLEGESLRVVKFYDYFDATQTSRIKELTEKHVDGIERDLYARIDRTDRKHLQLESLATLKLVSPNSPGTIERRLKLEPKLSLEHVPAWETQYSTDPSMLQLLSKTYLNNGQPEAARRCLAQCAKVAPSFTLFRQFAELELQLGNRQQWIEKLTESLNYPVAGLEHAQVNKALCEYYLDKKQPEKALPYAEDASTTGAGWAWNELSNVYVELGRWDEAEELQARNTTRYFPSSGMGWYWWCFTHQRGDLDAARTQAEKWLSIYEGHLRTPEQKSYLVQYHRTNGDLEKALKVAIAIADSSPQSYHSWHAMILAEQLKRPEISTRMLNRIVQLEEVAPATQILSGSSPIAQAILDLKTQDRPGDLEIEWCDIQIARMTDGSPTAMWFLLAEYLGLYDRTEDSIRYFERAAASPRTAQHDRSLAAQKLIKLGRKIPETRKLEFIKPANSPISGFKVALDHSDYPNRAVFLDDQNTVITSTLDGVLHLWKDGQDQPKLKIVTDGLLQRVSGDSLAVLTTSIDGEYSNIWDTQTGKKLRTVPKTGARMLMTGFLGSDLNSMITVQSLIERDQSSQFIWVGRFAEKSNDKFIWKYQLSEKEFPFVVTVNPAGTAIQLITSDGKKESRYLALSAADGRILEEQTFAPSLVSRSRIIHDASVLVTLSPIGELVVRDMITWKSRFGLKDRSILMFDVDSNKKLLAAGHQNGDVSLFNLDTGERLQRFAAHLTQTRDLSFNSDGTLLVTSGLDLMVRVWDVAEILGAKRSSDPENATP